MPGNGMQNNGLFHRLTVSAEGYPSGQRGQTVNLLAHAFGGSNPPPSTTSTVLGTDGGTFEDSVRRVWPCRFARCGSSSMVEPQPSKLMVRVRFPSPAPLQLLSLFQIAHVAQSVEHFLGKEEVTGSIPVMSTIPAIPAQGWRGFLSNQNASGSSNHGQG